jgi:ABC-2 type transport system ATP-binding protein
MSNTMLEIENLHKSFGKREILKGISLNVEKGDIYGFLGPNGSGKTTTIRCILGLVHHQQGRVLLNGQEIQANFKACISKIGTVVETPKFYDQYSGYQNLKLMLDLYQGIPDRRIDEVLEIVGMKERAGDKVKTYSLGMKQRLGIARALLHQPELVILDEPTNGLDPQGMKEIREMIIQLSSEYNITFFISTHLLSEVEILCNRVGILKSGQKVADGEVQSLLKQENEVLEIISADYESILSLMSGLKFILSVKQSEKGLYAEILKGYSYPLIKELVGKNIHFDYVIPRTQSLENYYLGLTEGGKNIE